MTNSAARRHKLFRADLTVVRPVAAGVELAYHVVRRP
jgi:hypothetical protein